jgi:hypothetical protein
LDITEHPCTTLWCSAAPVPSLSQSSYLTPVIIKVNNKRHMLNKNCCIHAAVPMLRWNIN